jgi:hypothetical protein
MAWDQMGSGIKWGQVLPFASVPLRASVSTGAIVERIDAGETIDDLATDYGLNASEIEHAVLFERAA